MNARNWYDQRTTADIRMALAPTYSEPKRATDPAYVPKGTYSATCCDTCRARLARQERAAAATGAGEVWCSHCDRAATVEVRLTTGETRAYCGTCLRRLTIQRGSISALRQMGEWSGL